MVGITSPYSGRYDLVGQRIHRGIVNRDLEAKLDAFEEELSGAEKGLLAEIRSRFRKRIKLGDRNAIVRITVPLYRLYEICDGFYGKVGEILRKLHGREEMNKWCYNKEMMIGEPYIVWLRRTLQ